MTGSPCARTGSVLVVFCLAVLVFLRPAAAMYVSGSDLARSCLSERDEDVHACVHYVAGVIDYHTVMQSLGTAPTLPFCIPQEIDLSKAALIVLAYLRTQPQHENFIAAMAVPLALNRAFPCRKHAARTARRGDERAQR